MEKRTDEVDHSLCLAQPADKPKTWNNENTIDLCCIAALWGCGGVMSTIQLALQEPSHLAPMRYYQNVSPCPEGWKSSK
jgi:hypothetical protein